MFAAHRDVFRALISMADLDPDAVGGTIQRTEEHRAGGMALPRRAARRAGPAAPRRLAEAAAHLLWVLTSFDAFDLLSTGRGLSADEAARPPHRDGRADALR